MLRPGSSPRGRGKLEPLDDNRDRCRLIPARAGKTGHVNDGFGGHRGSSPRGRGKRNPCDSAEKPGWLIPARAGKTRSAAGVLRECRAHPRAGGENAGKTLDVLVAPGSSPRGRGKPCRRRVSRPVGGLIPARAGKTRPCSSRPRTCRAHPRAGGENDRREVPAPIFLGSSPRGRGKLCRTLERVSDGGLIPARAGKTISCSFSFAFASAHPRAGGENPRPDSIFFSAGGSSPRGRGKLSGGHILPRIAVAHPRAGGENCLAPRG